MDIIQRNNHVMIIMGVSGCGKSTVASRLSSLTGWKMLEGDNFHSFANKEKMASSIALNNEDRMPWIDAIADHINARPDGPLLLSCSALTTEVRDRLLERVNRSIYWIYLEVDKDILLERLNNRKDHFMSPQLLDSQLEALVVPEDAKTINANMSFETICSEILYWARHLNR